MLLYGKPIADKIENDIISTIEKLKYKSITPAIAVIRMGDNPDDISYEQMIHKKSNRLGISFKNITLAADTTQYELECAVRNANFDREIHGILLLSPLAPHINEEKICSIIPPNKDIDGVTALSAAHIYSGTSEGFYPCTAESCIRILDYYGIDISGKDITIIGRSKIIGKPVSMLLLDRNASITICHSKTKKLKEKCLNADIIISSTGKAEFLDEEYLKESHIVIDVGISFNTAGKLVGDVDSHAADKLNITYSPVPGGVGAVTSSLLLWHTVLAAYNTLKE